MDGVGDPRAARTPIRALLAFGFPALPHAFVALPLNTVIPAYYASHTAVTMVEIGVFTSASRLLDAFLDPLVGFASDRLDTPIGKRKPWGLAAAAVCSISLFFLFQPPAHADIVYYGAWSFALYFGFSLFEIPRAAWSAEISRDYHERSRINSYIAQFNTIGSLVFWLTPILLAAWTGTTQISRPTLVAIAWLYLILMPSGLALAAWIVPNGRPVVTRALKLVDIAKSIWSNKPYRYYLLCYGLWGLGQGASLSVTLLFLTDRMRLGDLFPFLMIALFISTIVAIPLWMRLVPRYGRHKVWAMGLILSAVSRPLVLLFAPGHTAAIPMIALTVLSGVFTAPWNFAPSSLLSDVIDYDLWKSRTNKAGNLFAINTLLIKATMAIGAGGAFILLGMFGYQAGKTTNTGLADIGLIVCYMAVPGVFHMATGLLAWNFPLTARGQSIVRRRLEGRARPPAIASAATLAAEPLPSGVAASNAV
jgi:Na+/melibiose symporter-like transporter